MPSLRAAAFKKQSSTETRGWEKYTTETTARLKKEQARASVGKKEPPSVGKMQGASSEAAGLSSLSPRRRHAPIPACCPAQLPSPRARVVAALRNSPRSGPRRHACRPGQAAVGRHGLLRWRALSPLGTAIALSPPGWATGRLSPPRWATGRLSPPPPSVAPRVACPSNRPSRFAFDSNWGLFLPLIFGTGLIQLLFRVRVGDA